MMQYRRRGTVEWVAKIPVESQWFYGCEAMRDKCALQGEEREKGGEVEFVSRVENGKGFGVAIFLGVSLE